MGVSLEVPALSLRMRVPRALPPCFLAAAQACEDGFGYRNGYAHMFGKSEKACSAPPPPPPPPPPRRLVPNEKNCGTPEVLQLLLGEEDAPAQRARRRRTPQV